MIESRQNTDFRTVFRIFIGCFNCLVFVPNFHPVSVGGLSGGLFLKTFKLFNHLMFFGSKYRFGKLRASRIKENYETMYID